MCIYVLLLGHIIFLELAEICCIIRGEWMAATIATTLEYKKKFQQFPNLELNFAKKYRYHFPHAGQVGLLLGKQTLTKTQPKKMRRKHSNSIRNISSYKMHEKLFFFTIFVIIPSALNFMSFPFLLSPSPPHYTMIGETTCKGDHWVAIGLFVFVNKKEFPALSKSSYKCGWCYR
ncbi:hypothetical protein BDA99DRAFT_539689 [Phascolomyces articulosus]|uniref:Homing endonuclease LAGLIDADG domain-containing protein n=1 Tax=Phascolomyces articulosus TaxID=60185 RepID=A0AAD5K5A8_9FUNG|nr:hypothetical protein BDA99DRAFT_539689 [Phascolomyces articulosus]